MRSAEIAALWIIAVGVIAAGLYLLREPLTQFAMAIFIWLAIDGLANGIERRFKFLPRFLALPIAIVLVLGIGAVVIVVASRNIGAFMANAEDYQFRLNQLAAQVHQWLGLGGPSPTVGEMLAQLDPPRLAAAVGQAVQGFASNATFTLIFLGFLFSAARLMPQKLDRIFPDSTERERTRETLASIRTSMETYLVVQTILSVITTALTYVTLVIIGLDHALFWSFLIFFLNYIPTIGSIFAVTLPTMFALVQFPTLAPVIGTFVGISFWQFAIGNFLQPRMTGDSLNLSAVVVLLSLAIWGTIWGIAGAFLSAPLTVMLMIILAQFPSTRWIAILLSNDGKPTRLKPPKKESKRG